MKVLRVGERHYINIDTITSINCDIPPFIQIAVKGNKFYDLRYTEENYVEFCTKLIEKIIDDEIKIVDLQEIKNEVCVYYDILRTRPKKL